MPLITVTYSSEKPAAKATIAAEVSRLSSTILGKDPKVTAIVLHRVEPEDWFAGGRSLADAGLASFWLDTMTARAPELPRTCA